MTEDKRQLRYQEYLVHVAHHQAALRTQGEMLREAIELIAHKVGVDLSALSQKYEAHNEAHKIELERAIAQLHETYGNDRR